MSSAANGLSDFRLAPSEVNAKSEANLFRLKFAQKNQLWSAEDALGIFLYAGGNKIR